MDLALTVGRALLLTRSWSVLQVHLREGDISFDEFLAASPPHAEVQPVIGDVDVTSNILFSSGTTGAACETAGHKALTLTQAISDLHLL